MTFEASHKKTRITRPRRTDRTVASVLGRSVARDENGRVGVGNTLATGRGWKRALRRMLPPGTTVEHAVADAEKLYLGGVRELAHDNPFARASVVNWVTHLVLASSYAAAAIAAGLGTEAGLKLDERATKHADLAELSAVAALDWAKAPHTKPQAKKAPTRTAALRAQIGGGE